MLLRTGSWPICPKWANGRDRWPYQHPHRTATAMRLTLQRGQTMAQRQESRADPGEAWNQTMQGFTHAAAEFVGQTLHWQQDLVRLWVDTQQQLAGFWMRTQDETMRVGERAAQAGERRGARNEPR